MKEEYFIEIFKKNKNMLLSIAMKSTLDKEKAKDAVQETFLKAWKHRDNYKEHQKPGAWLNTILKNTLIDQSRERYSQRRQYVKEEFYLNIPELSKSESFFNIEDLIPHIPEKFKKEFEMFYIDFFSYKDISKILGIQEHKVKSRIHKARVIAKKIIIEKCNK